MHRGKQVFEPGGLDGRGARTRTEAETKLGQRLAEIRTDRYVGPQSERVTVESLLDSYIVHLGTKGAKGTAQVRSHVKKVAAFFYGARVVDVTTGRLREFIAERIETGDAPATVNRGLQDLRAAFNLGRKEERLVRVPFFPLLREDNARRNFFERAEHEAIQTHLPDPYRDIAAFAYRTGWRRGEIEPLEWKDVDREAGTVSLWTSKNGEPRTFPFRDDAGDLTELGELIEERWALRTYQTKKGPGASSLVFHQHGRRVWTFDEKWRAAAVTANLGGYAIQRYDEDGNAVLEPGAADGRRWATTKNEAKDMLKRRALPGSARASVVWEGPIFHDYRRTAVRDLIRAGVPQAIAMSITGHKTDAVFRRYNITNDADKREALGKLATYRATKSTAPNIVAHVPREERQFQDRGAQSNPDVSEIA